MYLSRLLHNVHNHTYIPFEQHVENAKLPNSFCKYTFWWLKLSGHVMLLYKLGFYEDNKDHQDKQLFVLFLKYLSELLLLISHAESTMKLSSLPELLSTCDKEGMDV